MPPIVELRRVALIILAYIFVVPHHTETVKQNYYIQYQIMLNEPF